MALVITRRLHESIKIGENVYVTVGRIHGNKIRLNIEAPPEVQVVRTEIIGTDADVPNAKRAEVPAR